MRTHTHQAPSSDAGAQALQKRVYARATYDSAAERFARDREGLASGSPHAQDGSNAVATTRGEVESRAIPAGLVESALSGGRQLETSTRAEYESRFGVDFSRVKVHTGESAARSADALGASAYTVGHDIVFGRGMFRPESNEGGRRIAHELAHVAWHSSLGAGAPPVLYAQSVRRPAAAAAQPAAAPSLLLPLHYTHTVLSGEALSVIVRNEYGDASLMPLVAARNGIQPPDYRILRNDVLALPPIVAPAHSTHVVASGETLSEIVLDEYGDAELWHAVADLLGMTHPFVLAAGQRLSLPRVATPGANIPNVLPASVQQPSTPAPSAPPATTPTSPPSAPDAGTRDAASDAAAHDAGTPGRQTSTAIPTTPATPTTPTRSPARPVPPTPAPTAAPPASAPPQQAGDIPRSAPTTPGRGATPEQQAADEWNRFPAVRAHVNNLQAYIDIRPAYQRSNIANPAEYIQRNIRTVSFFGHRAQAHYEHMQPVLTAAQESLTRRGITPQFLAQPRGFSPFQGLNARLTRGTPTISTHASGHAVDINAAQNPIFKNPLPRNNPDRLADAAFIVIEAVTGLNLRTLPRANRQHTAPTGAGTQVRLPPSSEHGPAEIEAMRRAGVQFYQTFNDAWIRRQRARLQQLRRVTSPTAEEQAELRRLEQLDRALTVLQREPNSLRNLDRLRDVAHGPGFISLEYELIDALRTAGMRWGGDYHDSRDFMHFEIDRWI